MRGIIRKLATALSGITLIAVGGWSFNSGVLRPLATGVTKFFAETSFERSESPVGFWVYCAAAAFTALICVVLGLYAFIGGLLGHVTLESIEVERGHISIDGSGTDGDD